MDESLSARALATKRIGELGDQLRAVNPALSPASARVQARKGTEDGRSWAAIERDPDAHLSMGEFVAKKQERAALAKLGYRTWDQAQAGLARTLASEKNISLSEGLALVEKIAPEVCAQALRERRRVA